MKRTIALIGNPNSGKTTIFNMLTGTYQKVGNWTGVTTEKKEGKFRYDKNITVIDLPGLYSLDADSPDEKVVKEYLKRNKPDFILNVIDATCLERSLALTMSLLSLNIPTSVVLTHEDALKYDGISVNVRALEKLLGVYVTFICPSKKPNVLTFIERVVKSSKGAEKGDFGVSNSASGRKVDDELLEKRLKDVIIYNGRRKKDYLSKIDTLTTNKYLAFPIFFAVMLTVYFLSVKIGGLASSFISDKILWCGDTASSFLTSRGAPPWTISLLCDAIVGGFGTVLSFLPQILVLFALMGVIEQSGYATRIAFILDSIFRGVGLNGKSVMPLVACSGCTTTGLMCTRAIESANERRMTVILAPFMPCGAKTAVFGWLSYAFFDGNPLVATSMYFMALFSVGFFGYILKKFKPFRIGGNCFALEMPRLKIPRVKDILLSLKEKVKEFLGKAALIVFLVSVVVWALKNLGINGYTEGRVEQSFIYYIGNAIKYIFYPLGFCSWESSVALLSSFFAKEAVIESLKIVSDGKNLFSNGFAVYSFMAFILLSPPCMASIVTTYRELKSKKWLAFTLVFQFLSAYTVALSINLWGILSRVNACLPFLAIGAIIIVIKVISKRNKLWGKSIKRNTI